MSTAFPFYLARTAAEFTSETTPSSDVAWMACHFSGYGTGLSNLPKALPSGAMVILNDRIPVNGHNPQRILAQLLELTEKLSPSCILLDFQRPNEPQTARIVDTLANFSSCPLGVSEQYAYSVDCPVFLPSPLPDCPLADWLSPWKGREIWLDAALDSMCITITEQGCHREQQIYSHPVSECFSDPTLHTRYQITLEQDAAVFHLYRTEEDLRELLLEAETLGVTRAVGLYQELKTFSPFIS